VKSIRLCRRDVEVQPFDLDDMDDLRDEIDADTAHLVRIMDGYGFIVAQKDAEWAWLLYSQSYTATWLDVGVRSHHRLHPELIPDILLEYLQPADR